LGEKTARNRFITFLRNPHKIRENAIYGAFMESMVMGSISLRSTIREVLKSQDFPYFMPVCMFFAKRDPCR